MINRATLGGRGVRRVHVTQVAWNTLPHRFPAIPISSRDRSSAGLRSGPTSGPRTAQAGDLLDLRKTLYATTPESMVGGGTVARGVLAGVSDRDEDYPHRAERGGRPAAAVGLWSVRACSRYLAPGDVSRMHRRNPVPFAYSDQSVHHRSSSIPRSLRPVGRGEWTARHA